MAAPKKVALSVSRDRISKEEDVMAKAKEGATSGKKKAPAWTVVGTPGEEIKSEAYQGNASLVRVEIAEGVTEIGSRAFEECVNLESVRIPETVTHISYDAFSGCVKLHDVSFGSGDTNVCEDSFKNCVAVRLVKTPKGIPDDCALVTSRGYKALASIAEHNAKYGNDAQLKVARLTLWSYAPAIGFAYCDSLDEVDYDMADEIRTNYEHRGLDLEDLGGELTLDGEEVAVDVKKFRWVCGGEYNTWDEFRDKIGVYSVDLDKDCIVTYVAFVGRFDPSKVKLHYRTAIGPGYFKDPTFAEIKILDDIEYDGLNLEYEYSDDSNNKGCMFTVFNKGKYAAFQDDMTDADWRAFPGCDTDEEIDFGGWEDWSEAEWKRYEEMLAKHDADIDQLFQDSWSEALDSVDFEQLEFLHHACARSADWLILMSWEFAHVLERVPSLVHDPRMRSGLLSNAKESLTASNKDGSVELYDDMEVGIDSDQICLWAYTLMHYPDLADECEHYELISGYSACRLLAKQPQLADRFAMDAIGDPSNKCWAFKEDGDFDRAWRDLVKSQPQFAKHYKGKDREIIRLANRDVKLKKGQKDKVPSPSELGKDILFFKGKVYYRVTEYYGKGDQKRLALALAQDARPDENGHYDCEELCFDQNSDKAHPVVAEVAATDLRYDGIKRRISFVEAKDPIAAFLELNFY